MNALTQPDLADIVAAALSDGVDDSLSDALAHHLAKRGLVIVEASKWGSAKAALMVIGSCGALDGKPAVTALELAADVARCELKKMEA